MKNQFEKIKSMSLIEFKDFLLGMKIDGTGCGNCVLCDKYCNSIAGEICEINILNWLNSKIDMTADEMFEELGYKVRDYETYEKQNNDKIIQISILKKGNYRKLSYIIGYEYRNDNYPEIITEEEDKAIHKKIEELKKWEEDN